MRILVIEDDPTVGQYVKRGLEEHRWAVDLVTDGEEGERRASSEAYDVIVLDMRLPGKSGLEVLNALRGRGFERPVLVLTAQDAVDAKVTALRAGADDYVTKPFAFEELLARVEALARRPRALASLVLTVGDLVLDQATREVRRGGELIDLTPKEYTVLEYLMRHAGRVMSRTLITEYAWGYHFDPGRAAHVQATDVRRLDERTDAGHQEHQGIGRRPRSAARLFHGARSGGQAALHVGAHASVVGGRSDGAASERVAANRRNGRRH